MASLPPITTTFHHHQSLLLSNSHNNSSNSTLSISSNLKSTSSIHLNRPFLPYRFNPIAPSRRVFRASSSPPPDNPEPPFNEKPSSSTGVEATMSGFQDKAQIFVAVLFWMSLFFWACAWDGRDDGRPHNGSRFRK